jgi:coproporphyrinogen III oxidase-like Fe-S oxidoreductase
VQYLDDYYSWVDAERTEAQQQKMDNKKYMFDLVMKQLRATDGLVLKWIQERFGHHAVTSILKGANVGLELGLAEMVANDNEGQTLCLKDPEGLLYSNFIISSIFAELG